PCGPVQRRAAHGEEVVRQLQPRLVLGQAEPVATAVGGPGPVPVLLGIGDQLRGALALLELAPEARHVARNRLRGYAVAAREVLVDVVETDQPARADELRVELEVGADALVRVIAVDEQEVELPAPERALDRSLRRGVMRVAL